jgi:hypothetical protein
MALKNYHAMKDEELKEIMATYEIDEADYQLEKGGLNRKKLCNVLRLIDIQAGKIAETMVQKEDGEVKTYEPEDKLAKGLSGTMAQITFYSSDENDLPYVQLALNGMALIIPREVKSWIPKEFIDGVLQNAVATRMKMDVDRDGKIRYIPKQVPRIQFHTHDVKHIDELRRIFDEKKKEEYRKNNS